MINFRYLTYIIVLYVLTSCKNDDKALQKTIVGTWDVYASNMNNKPNGFMKDGYFVFSADSSVISNIYSANQAPKFIVDDGRLVIEGVPKLDLEIARLDQDTLFLKGKLSYYYMEYFMVRRKF